MAPCNSGNAANMIAMFVGNNDRVDRVNLHAEPRQTPVHFGNAETAVEHHYRASRLDQQSVATAAAAKASEAQTGHRN